MPRSTPVRSILPAVWLTLSCACLPAADATVDFGKKLRAWDGFGVNYIEPRHTRDFKVFPQDYGGFKYLNDAQREQVIDLVFGPDGLKPAIVKAFCDPFHEVGDPAHFDHLTTTRWIRYFCKRGYEVTRSRGDSLVFLAGLYGPPARMTKQKVLLGRDLAPGMMPQLAEYIAAWAKYLRDVEGLPVKYVSPFNESENKFRWPEDGRDPVSHYAADYNLHWPDTQVVDFLRTAREVLDRNGLKEVGLTNGEPESWGHVFRYEMKDGTVLEYARRIREDSAALKNLSLITSHGFQKLYDPRGIDLLREVRPDLHAWTTSSTWGDMSVDIVEEAQQLIYTSKVNALMPWATVHNDAESDKLSPPAGVRVSGNANSPIKTNGGKVEVTKAYYHFKQISRAGQAGMAVAEVSSDDAQIGLIAFASNGTRNPDAFTVINLSKTPKAVKVRVSGTQSQKLVATVTTDPDFGNRNYESFRDFVWQKGVLEYNAPPRSSITFTTAR